MVPERQAEQIREVIVTPYRISRDLRIKTSRLANLETVTNGRGIVSRRGSSRGIIP
jgi:hypothetical protein